MINVGHRCNSEGCGQVLVLDGNQKNNRPVCAAEEAGYIEYASLPGKVKTGCMNSPEQQSKFCSVHKPRHMQSHDSVYKGDSDGRVAESILRKKETRNGTYYEVQYKYDTRVHKSLMVSIGFIWRFSPNCESMNMHNMLLYAACTCTCRCCGWAKNAVMLHGSLLRMYRLLLCKSLSRAMWQLLVIVLLQLVLVKQFIH